MIVDQFVVAGIVGGRHRALVHPKQVHAIPFELRRCKFVEQEPRRCAAGDRESCEAPRGKRLLKQTQNVLRARRGGPLHIPRDEPIDAHFSSAGSVSEAARAKALSKTGSRRTIPSSSRMSRYSVG